MLYMRPGVGSCPGKTKEEEMEIKYTITPEEVREIVKEYVLRKYPGLISNNKILTVDDGYNYKSFVVEIKDKKEIPDQEMEEQ